MKRNGWHLGRRTGVFLVLVYQKLISPLKPTCCRFYPTCSCYALEVIRRFGLIKGSWLALKRILRCHPFYKGDLYDPPPGRKEDDDKKTK